MTRRHAELACLIGLLLACSGATPGSATARTVPASGPGDHAFELVSGGRHRRYLVHVPSSTSRDPRPVMLALHGGGGSADQFKRESRLDRVADAKGFVAVYPDGTGPLATGLHTWNAGPTCCGSAQRDNVDDVRFLADVIEDLARRMPIDRHRVYLTGHSNGGIMAYRFASERSDLVSAIVPVSGAMAVADYAPTHHVAILDIHSVDDPRAPYAGGLGPPFPGTSNRVMHRPVLDGLAAWARANGCTDTLRTISRRQGTARNRGQSVTHLAYGGCPPDGPVEHLRLTGVGHGWPGGVTRPDRSDLIGPATTIINAGEEAWRFASRFSR